jgi:hypothetical protein
VYAAVSAPCVSRKRGPLNETILACAPQFSLYGIARTVGDLYFTNRRVLFAKTGSTVLLNVGGIFGIIGRYESLNASKALRSQPITAIEAATRADNCYPYVELESILIKRPWLPSSLVILQCRDGKRTKFHGRRAAVAELVMEIPALRQAGAPIELL